MIMKTQEKAELRTPTSKRIRLDPSKPAPIAHRSRSEYRSHMTPSLPLAHHDIAPTPPPTLAELVAKARHAKQPKTAQLEAHREELLRLRRAGDSVEVLAIALSGLGVEISPEALRLWLNRELGHKPIRRRKVRFKPTIVAPVVPAPAAAPTPVSAPTPASAAASALAVGPSTPRSPADTPLERATSLIRAGETPMEAFARRKREREAEAAAAKTTGGETPGPRIARDDI